MDELCSLNGVVTIKTVLQCVRSTHVLLSQQQLLNVQFCVK